jgi:hypothetical protein
MVEIASQTAMWYSTGLLAVPLRWVLIRDPEGRVKTQALLCTDLDADQEDILRWIMKRWQLEVTFQEMRRHLGFETQRQWSDLAIRRTTPALLGMFSLVTLFAHGQMRQAAGALRRQAASGTTKLIRPSLMRLRWCVKSCGLRRSRLFGGCLQLPRR